MTMFEQKIRNAIRRRNPTLTPAQVEERVFAAMEEAVMAEDAAMVEQVQESPVREEVTVDVIPAEEESDQSDMFEDVSEEELDRED